MREIKRGEGGREGARISVGGGEREKRMEEKKKERWVNWVGYDHRRRRPNGTVLRQQQQIFT